MTARRAGGRVTLRIEARFLRSAVARRVLWVLLAAAALPLLLFAALAYGTLAEQLDSNARGRLHEAAKYAGLRVYDRLVSAQTTLATLAAVRVVVGDTAEVPAAVRKVFTGVITIDTLTGQVRGPAELAAAWQGVATDPAERRLATARSLWWSARSGRTDGRVMLSFRDGRHGWVGEVSPDFLWGDLRDQAAWASTCVADQHGQVLMCAHGPAPATGSVQASWNLFTRADFGSVDWVFTRRAPREAMAFGGLPVEPMLLKAAAFSLLLVVGLSLMLVRRTTVPLEQLMTGTRRLARRDWAARVKVGARDEFGELAEAFNDMAGRVQRQMQALQVQSGIDREILSSLDVARAWGLVLARLEALAPGSRVGLVLALEGGAGWQVLTTPGSPVLTVSIDAELLRRAGHGAVQLQGPDAREAAGWLPGPAGLGSAPGPSAAEGSPWVGLFPALSEDGVRAMVLMCGPLPPDGDTVSEIEGLADRLAVTLVAADRERELRERAVRDSLTGLTNRAGLIDVLDRRLADPQQRQAFVLVYIDLDGFKAVNDARGHPMGDVLLCEVAQLLREQALQADVIARVGGDEFVLLLPDGREAADAVASRLCQRLAQPFLVQGQVLRIGASIGLVHCPDDGRDRVELMRRADLAMYAGKAAGRGRHAWFLPAFDERAAERAWLQAELPGALQRNELCLHFQPRVLAGTGELASVEALIRWPHPTRGMVSPMRFVPMAEETGQIEQLGRWVLEAACRQLRQWRDHEVPVPRMSVNVSAQQLDDPAFAARVLAVLKRYGLNPADLELELTESLFAGDTEQVTERLSPLRDAGMKVALDDFGTGFSSLSSLHRLPVDVLKIDRSFVIDLGQRESADAVARSIVALARALGKQVVAEGVETEAQYRHLLDLGCDELQGFRFGRPMAPDALLTWLQSEAQPA